MMIQAPGESTIFGVRKNKFAFVKLITLSLFRRNKQHAIN